MNPKEFARVLLLMAAQNDPQRADAIADYMQPMLQDEATQENPYPAGGIIPGPESVKPAKIGTDFIPDGIYLVFGETHASFKLYNPGTVTPDEKHRCTGVAVKMGSKSITVSLHNCADGNDITLTDREDKTRWNGYKDNSLDAGADWDGEGNTAHLKAIGLNPEIKLMPGEFIPSIAQWRLICLFRKELNEALAEIGGDELSGWYWTSTEYSATYAWYLTLSNGGMLGSTKASNAYRVRPVSAFIS